MCPITSLQSSLCIFTIVLAFRSPQLTAVTRTIRVFLSKLHAKAAQHFHYELRVKGVCIRSWRSANHDRIEDNPRSDRLQRYTRQNHRRVRETGSQQMI
jgi:hypothetical protein